MNEGQKKQSKGAYTEAKVTEKLLELGFSVSTPVFVQQKYDMIIDTGDGLLKAQVKTAYEIEREGRKKIDLRRGHPTSDGFKHKAYFEEEIDGFLSYIPEKDEVIWIPIDEASCSFTLCLDEKYTKCNGSNKERINLVSDFKIDRESGI